MVPAKEADWLVERLPAGAQHLVIPTAGHGGGHTVAPERYETEVTSFLRTSFRATREQGTSHRILAAESAEDALGTVPASHG